MGCTWFCRIRVEMSQEHRLRMWMLQWLVGIGQGYNHHMWFYQDLTRTAPLDRPRIEWLQTRLTLCRLDMQSNPTAQWYFRMSLLSTRDMWLVRTLRCECREDMGHMWTFPLPVVANRLHNPDTRRILFCRCNDQLSKPCTCRSRSWGRSDQRDSHHTTSDQAVPGTTQRDTAGRTRTRGKAQTNLQRKRRTPPDQWHW